MSSSASQTVWRIGQTPPAQLMMAGCSSTHRTGYQTIGSKTDRPPDHSDRLSVRLVTSHIYAANSGCNLFIRRVDDPITLIVNNTDVGLSTGDQPVVNLYAHTPRASRDFPNAKADLFPVLRVTGAAFGSEAPQSQSRESWMDKYLGTGPKAAEGGG